MLFGDVGAPLLLSLDGLRPRATRHTAAGWVSVTAPQPIEAGRWSHVAGVFDGRDLVLYVDGREVARAASGPDSGSERMALGRNPYDGSSRFSGLLAEVTLRGEALAADALAQPRPGEPAAP